MSNEELEFNRVVYHEFGHVISGYLNHKYRNCTIPAYVKIERTYDTRNDQNSFLGFTGYLESQEKLDNKDCRIMQSISGCIFQACYFQFKRNEFKLFGSCFCTPEISGADCNGYMDWAKVASIIGREKMNRYVHQLTLQINNSTEQIYNGWILPYESVINGFCKKWWEDFKDNKTKMKQYDFLEEILPGLETVNHDSIKEYYFKLVSELKNEQFGD